jgi:N-acetylglucosaminyl-diphospho-decaprenol L-rhamnosyltransferase
MSFEVTNIGAVIVTWNSSDAIERCLDSCAGFNVTVVDNASSDDTVARVRRYPDVYLIENPENRGFAAAVNQGIARSPAEYILLLNPDVELTGSIAPLQAACESNEAVIATGRLVDENGVTQRGFTVRRLPSAATLAFEVLGLNRLWPSNGVNRKYRCADLPLDAPADIEQPPGAFLFFKRDLWSDLGGFDEQFAPVWFEDVDFCKRALELGRIRYLPSVTARHRGGASIARMDWACRELCWYGSLLRYASKHFSPRQFRGVCGAVVLASAIRMAPAVFERRTLRALAVYANIAGLALRACASGRLVDPGRGEQFRQSSRVRTITNSTE